MKLKKGLRKEDSYGCKFNPLSYDEGIKLQSALFDLGLRWRYHGITGLRLDDDFIIISQDGFMEKLPKVYYNDFNLPEKTLSDLIEEEPKYVRCINNKKAIHPITLGKIYPTVLSIGALNSGFMIKDDNDNRNIFFHDRFESATEQDYINQQSNIEQEEALKMPDTKKEDITDFEISALYESAKKGDCGTVLYYLKEWFPSASCFKEPEKTYKLGDKFTWNEDGEIWQINRCSSVARRICLNNDKGEILNQTTSVQDIHKIKQDELNNIRFDFFEKTTFLK